MIRSLVPDLGLRVGNSSIRSDSSLIPKKVCSLRKEILTKQRNSLFTHGVLLFNSVPDHIRNIKNNLMEFKVNLDKFLKNVPDHPPVPGIVPKATNHDGRLSNCLIDWSLMT